MGAKLALRLRAELRMPRQLGPTMRSMCGRAAFSMRRLSDSPESSTASRKPALKTTAARVPRWPRTSISSGTVAAGVQMTARSGAIGRSLTSG